MHSHRRRRNRLHAYCSRCRHKQVFVRAANNHLLHLFLTVLTGGLWLVSWVAVCIGKSRRPWRCEHCGWHEPEFGTVSIEPLSSKRQPQPLLGVPARH
jgi:hypothetical protein